MKIKSLLLALVCTVVLSSCENNCSVLTTEVSNSTAIARVSEDVEISWSVVSKKLDGVTASPSNLVVMSNDVEQPYQIIFDANGAPKSVLIQASVCANSSEEFLFSVGTPSEFKIQTFGRLVPERMDDFAWENNRIAFRMYGPALEATGEISNGLDVWAKRTEDMVINEWFGHMDYHTDHGNGMDFYKVGRSLGAGVIAPIVNGELVLGHNFTESKVLENGPLRTVFELSYAPLQVGDVVVNEKRVVSLSANSNFNKITQYFSGDGFASLDAGSGIVLGIKDEVVNTDIERGTLTLIEPKNEAKGELYISVILGDSMKESKTISNHAVAVTEIKNNVPFVYYMGNGWSRSGFDAASWADYTAGYADVVSAEPLVISFK